MCRPPPWCLQKVSRPRRPSGRRQLAKKHWKWRPTRRPAPLLQYDAPLSARPSGGRRRNEDHVAPVPARQPRRLQLPSVARGVRPAAESLAHGRHRRRVVVVPTRSASTSRSTFHSLAELSSASPLPPSGSNGHTGTTAVGAGSPTERSAAASFSGWAALLPATRQRCRQLFVRLWQHE